MGGSRKYGNTVEPLVQLHHGGKDGVSYDRSIEILYWTQRITGEAESERARDVVVDDATVVTIAAMLKAASPVPDGRGGESVEREGGAAI